MMTIPATAPPTGNLPILHLLAGHERRVSTGALWVYSNELQLDAAAKVIEPGALVQLQRADGVPIGIASFNRNTLIAARLWTRDITRTIDADFLGDRLLAAEKLRQRFYTKPYYRLIHAEGDGLPGMIIDRYGDVFVVQLNTAGAEGLRETLLDVIEVHFRPQAIVLRNDSPYRKLEGLEPQITLGRGHALGEIIVEEHGMRHLVAPLDGQKTGWFFDLHQARGLIARLARGTSVLDLCCHTGAFGLAALGGQAKQALFIDRSDAALEQARQSVDLNKLGPRAQFVAGDLFEQLERLRDQVRSFDLVIADPPSFAKVKRDVPQGLKAYRKLAKLAARLVNPGGFLFIASCSHNIETAAFKTEVARGLGERGARVVVEGGAGPDHPVHPQLPETGYLKWQILQLD